MTLLITGMPGQPASTGQQVLASGCAWPTAIRRLNLPVYLTSVSIRSLAAADADQRQRLADSALGEAEQSTYADIWLPRRRLEWLAGRLAAKQAVLAFMAEFGRPVPAMNQIEVGATVSGPTRGQPVVNHPVRISLSHSTELAVAAAGRTPLGVDVEKIRALAPPLQSLLRADPVERRQPSMPLSLRWSCKEAVLKCLGLGMRADLRQIQLLDWNRTGRYEWLLGPQLQAQINSAQLPTSMTGWGLQRAGYSFAVTVAEPAV